MIKKNKRKKERRTWERVINRKDEKMGMGRGKYEMMRGKGEKKDSEERINIFFFNPLFQTYDIFALNY